MRQAKKRRPTPWSFHAAKYGLHNVIVDAEQGPIAIAIAPETGPLIAAAPDLLKALETIAQEAPVGSAAWHTANQAIDAEQVRERKADEGSEQ